MSILELIDKEVGATQLTLMIKQALVDSALLEAHSLLDRLPHGLSNTAATTEALSQEAGLLRAARACAKAYDIAAAAGRYADALSMAQQEHALLLACPSLRQDQTQVAEALTRIACGLESLGRVQEALPLARQVVEVHEYAQRQGGEEQQQCQQQHQYNMEREVGLASAKVVLARVLTNASRPVEAMPLFQEALKVLRARHGDNHVSVIGCLNNMGGCLKALDRFPEALACHEHSLQVMVKAGHVDHPLFHTTASNIASCYYSMGRCVPFRTALHSRA